MDLHRAAALLREHLLENARIIDLVRGEHAPRHRRDIGVVLRDESAKAGRCVLVGNSFELVCLHRHHASLPHREHRHHGTPALESNGHTVLVRTSPTQHGLALLDALDGAEAVAEARRHLIFMPSRGAIHLIAQLVLQPVRAAVHELLYLVEQTRVLLRLDLLLTGAGASLDVVVEADVPALEDLVAAGAKREDGAK